MQLGDMYCYNNQHIKVWGDDLYRQLFYNYFIHNPKNGAEGESTDQLEAHRGFVADELHR